MAIGDAVLGNDADVEISNSAQNTAFIDNLRFVLIHADALILFQFSKILRARCDGHRYGRSDEN